MSIAGTIASPDRPAGGGFGRGLASLALGAGFTLVLFLGISRFDRQAAPAQSTEIVDLRAVSVQEPPPPPREVSPPDQAPLPDTALGLESAASDSPVQIAVVPPDLRELLPPPPVAPPAVIQVGRLDPGLKPRIDLTVPGDHIFQTSEVDRVPQVLNRVSPFVPTSVRNGAAELRVSLIFVVDADGAIKNVRLARPSGNPDFDAIALQNIHEWTFAPAVRRGVKVRCLLQQAIIVRWSRGSVFEP